jgi:hypothetical protein
MNNSILINRILAALLACASPLISYSALSMKPSMKNYQRLNPVMMTVDLKKLKIDDRYDVPDAELSSGHNCALVRPNLCIAIGSNLSVPEANRGVNLFLIENINGKFKIRAKSGGGRGYARSSPTFYRHPSNGSLVILLDYDELEAYGFEAFILQNQNIKATGYLDLAAFDIKGNPSSVSPYVTIHQEGSNIIIRFNRDVMLERDGLPPVHIKTKKFEYVYGNSGWNLRQQRVPVVAR